MDRPTDNVCGLTEYLLPRWMFLLAHGFAMAPVEIQLRMVREIVSPLLGLTSHRTFRQAVNFVIVMTHIYASDGNLTAAARTLKVSRSTVVRVVKKMDKAGLDFSRLAALCERYLCA